MNIFRVWIPKPELLILDRRLPGQTKSSKLGYGKAALAGYEYLFSLLA